MLSCRSAGARDKYLAGQLLHHRLGRGADTHQGDEKVDARVKGPEILSKTLYDVGRLLGHDPGERQTRFRDEQSGAVMR